MVERRSKARVELPALLQLFFRRPDARGKTCEVGGAQGGRLRDLRAVDGNAEEISLELHEEVVGYSAAVDLERGEAVARVSFHRAEHVARLIGERIERGADEMRLLCAARDADDHAARVHIPVRRTKTDECGNHVDAARVRNLLRDPFGVGCGVNEAQSVAQPLDCGAADED